MALPIPRFEWRSQLRQAPEEPLLLGWNAIVPRLRGLLRAVFTTRDVDLDRAVDTFARASDTGRLPMRHRRRWGPLVQVWVDVSERLTPYSQDYRVILGELLTRLGRSRVEVVSLHKPGELNWFYDTRGRKRLNAPLPPPETHVLVLGDLGSPERNSSESRQRWLEFGRILRGRGCHPLALVPCALARVPLALRQ
ncbi:MAG: hypothetical protein ACKOJF_12180, partial [Planctomycetaceae bacterium]